MLPEPIFCAVCEKDIDPCELETIAGDAVHYWCTEEYEREAAAEAADLRREYYRGLGVF